MLGIWRLWCAGGSTQGEELLSGGFSSSLGEADLNYLHVKNYTHLRRWAIEVDVSNHHLPKVICNYSAVADSRPLTSNDI